MHSFLVHLMHVHLCKMRRCAKRAITETIENCRIVNYKEIITVFLLLLHHLRFCVHEFEEVLCSFCRDSDSWRCRDDPCEVVGLSCSLGVFSGELVSEQLPFSALELRPLPPKDVARLCMLRDLDNLALSKDSRVTCNGSITFFIIFLITKVEGAAKTSGLTNSTIPLIYA